jgi:hypothetical protein
MGVMNVDQNAPCFIRYYTTCQMTWLRRRPFIDDSNHDSNHDSFILSSKSADPETAQGVFLNFIYGNLEHMIISVMFLIGKPIVTTYRKWGVCRCWDIWSHNVEFKSIRQDEEDKDLLGSDTELDVPGGGSISHSTWIWPRCRLHPGRLWFRPDISPPSHHPLPRLIPSVTLPPRFPF